ncbi:MAG: YaaL family protein [Eubacteriales bacterium]
MKFHFRLGQKPAEDEYPKTAKECLLADIEKTRFELETAYSGFDYVTEPDLIDCYIYDINAILKRYKYLLEQASLLDTVSEEKTPLLTPSPSGVFI